MNGEIMLNKYGEPCEHKLKFDLRHGKGKHPNEYCPECKCHWWKGKFYTPEEWDDYVNEE